MDDSVRRKDELFFRFRRLAESESDDGVFQIQGKVCKVCKTTDYESDPA